MDVINYPYIFLATYCIINVVLIVDYLSREELL